MSVTDSELLQRFAKAGSEPAFHELVKRHLPLVWGTARRVANGDEALAEDISQIVFADLARQAGKLQPGAEVGAWLEGDGRPSWKRHGGRSGEAGMTRCSLPFTFMISTLT